MNCLFYLFYYPYSDRLLITPFSAMVVPPPMSAYNIKTEKSINQVCFGPSVICNDLAVVLADMSIAIYTYYNDIIDVNLNNESVKLSGAGGAGFRTSLKLPTFRGIFKCVTYHLLTRYWIILQVVPN